MAEKVNRENSSAKKGLMIMTMKHQELLKMSSEELNQKAIELKQDLAKERAVVASGTRSEKPGKIRKLRREIARILTALSTKNKKEAMN
jgi:large subunit ribosomal protein L29